VAHAKLGGVGH